MPSASVPFEPGIEGADDPALGRDPLRREPKLGDRERLGMVGEDLERVAATAGGLGHLLAIVWTRPTSQVAVAVAPEVGQVTRWGRRPARAASISPLSSRSSGSMKAGRRNAYALGLGGEGP